MICHRAFIVILILTMMLVAEADHFDKASAKREPDAVDVKLRRRFETQTTMTPNADDLGVLRMKFGGGWKKCSGTKV